MLMRTAKEVLKTLIRPNIYIYKFIIVILREQHMMASYELNTIVSFEQANFEYFDYLSMIAERFEYNDDVGVILNV